MRIFQKKIASIHFEPFRIDFRGVTFFFRPRLTLVREGLLFSYHLVKKCEFFKNFFTSIRFELFIIDFRGVPFFCNIQICHSFLEILISPKRVNIVGWNLVKSFIREFSRSPVNFRLIRRSLPPKKGVQRTCHSRNWTVSPTYTVFN